MFYHISIMKHVDYHKQHKVWYNTI